MKNKSQLSPALPDAEPPLRVGFTVWTELNRRSAAEVLSFRQILDRHLAGQSLVRSMNPLHMLVWSPTRDMTAVDQVALLAFAAAYGRMNQMQLGALRTHVGIPALPGRDLPLIVRPNDAFCQAVLLAYRYCGHGADWVLDQFRAAAADQT